MSERIESLISKEALAQFDQLNQKVESSVATFEKLIAKGVALNKELGGVNGFKDLTASAKQLEEAEAKLAKAQADLIAAQERLKKAQDDELKKLSDLEKQKAKLNSLYTEEAKQIAEVKSQQQARNQAIKEEVQLNSAAEGSIKQKQIQVKQLQRDYDNLSQAQREASQGQDLLKNIQALDKELKSLEGSTGRFQRNVGNYANAFSDAFGTIGGQLQKIQQQIKSGDNGVQQLQSLQRQETILLNITEQLGQEFSSTKQQSRAFQEAVQQIGLAFGHQSEVFQAFKDQVGEGVDSLNDIRDSIKLAASDTRQLDRLIGAATAIAGGFSIAQGAAGLFGNENEDLQKSLVKIQSVMAILNGLQAIQNELKNKDSILRKLSSFLIKEETKGLQGQAVAQQANATATNAAAKATSRFGVALKSIGIGILLTLIPLASSAMGGLSAVTRKVDKDLEGMGDTASEIASSAIQLLDDEIKNLNDSLKLTPSSLDKAKKALALLKNEVKDQQIVIPTNIAGFSEAKQAVKDIISIIKTGSTEVDQFIELSNKIQELEFLQKLKTAQAFLDAEYEANKNAEKNNADLDKDANERRLNELKKNFEDRKITEQAFAKGSKASLQNNLNDELKIIQANLDLQLSQSGGVAGKIRQVQDNADKERLLAYRNYNQKLKEVDDTVLKRQIEDAERKRKALLKILTIEVEDQIKAQDLIANDESKSFDERTDALYESYTKRRQLITANYEYERQQAKKSEAIPEELIAIEEKALSDINQITIEYGLQQQAIYSDNQDKINEIIEKSLQRRKNIISGNESDAIVALNDQLKAGLITVEEYNRQRSKIEKSARIQQIKEEINDLTGKKITLISQQKQQSNEFISIEEAEKKKRKELSDELTDEVIANEQRLTDLKKQLASEYFETFNSFASAQFENEIARIQQQMAEVDRQKEHDIAAANATITNKQERETAIAKIEVRAQAERERLERRQRQIELERARFEKAANIAQIIGNTAVAIMNQLKVTPLPAGAPFIAAIGTIGALQLARAIAAPLPKFAEGTDDALGGLAWVGDAYRKELVITPQGKVMETPSVPTVMNVPKHSIVLPDARAALESGLAVNQHGRLVQSDNSDIKEVGRKIDTLTKVMRNKPVLNMNATERGLTAIWYHGANTAAYIEDQTRF